nr:hypothetical protein [Nocardia nova]
MVDDGLLHQLDWEMWQVTDAILPAAADEVAVTDAAPALGLGVDQTGRSSGLSAPLAEQEALEVMLVYPVALSSATAQSEDFLHALEQFVADEGLMASGVYLPLVPHKADVVRVAQHRVEFAARNRLLWIAFRRLRGEPEVGHCGFEPFDRVLVGGVQLECS